MKFHTAALVHLVVLGFAVSNAQAKDPPLLSLNMEHFRDTATVKIDPTDAVTTITTENGYVEHTGLMRMVWNDEYLKGVIDKKTGQKSFQVYASIVYGGNQRSFATATYQAAGGTQSVPVTAVSAEVTGCAVGDCTYTERIAFPVDEEYLRQLAAAYVPGRAALWHFKVIPKSGPAYAGQISNAEIVGFLTKVDEVTGALPVSIDKAANASLKLDLGIGGMAVAATPEQPKRAGVLITAVTHGSVAQKSGIIVGDILFELDGHPITTPADLEAAVAACAANSTIAIKLYRGTDTLALKARF
ncbi:MAG TPA: PDZ domain-containing protein [Steroidobacteraceae bacterium]|nr:PDZ domain-containing protein [Steroidobacteraceae bacterium]